MTLLSEPALRRLAAFSIFALAAATPLRAVDLKIDVNQRLVDNNVPANTEPGFTPMVITTAATGGIAAATVNSLVVGAQTVSINGTGSTTYDDRKRTTPANSGSFDQQALLQDFIFAISNAGNPDAGLDIAVTGLTPGRVYMVTVWSFDSGSTAQRVSDWSANGVRKVNNYTFNGSVSPATNTRYQINFNAPADGTGKILISGRRDSTSVDINNAASHGVFFNGLWVRDLYADTDNDFMADDWESAHGLTVGSDDAGLDADTDLSTNFEEFIADTDPQNPDSDNDTLLDGYENRSSTWVSTVNTGTSPVNPDTDGDGLTDSTERPNLPWLSPSQPGTDPNLYDTDGDFFSDGEEVTWPTNPRLAADFPNITAGSTLAVDLENTASIVQPGFQGFTGPGGTAGITTLSTAYGPYNVTIAAAGSTTLESRDRGPLAGGKGFNLMFRDFIYSALSDNDGDGMDITITGLTPLTVYPVTLWSWDPSSAGTARRSTWLASDGDAGTVVKVPQYSLVGATLPTTISDRRMQFEAKTDSTGTLVIQGRKEIGFTGPTINVFLNAFLIGAPLPSGPAIMITGIGPVTATGMSLTWTSQDSATYKVEVSPDLNSWTALSSTVDGQPDFTSYADTTAPPGTTKRFYRVSRVP